MLSSFSLQYNFLINFLHYINLSYDAYIMLKITLSGKKTKNNSSKSILFLNELVNQYYFFY